jgi:hypothetical protein
VLPQIFQLDQGRAQCAESVLALNWGFGVHLELSVEREDRPGSESLAPEAAEPLMRDEKSGLFYEQKSAGRRPLPRGTSSNAVAGTTDKLFYEGKRPDFFVESRGSTGDFGLTSVSFGR